ncbi:MAG TPA: methyltransferase domain-containing protein [Pyrinomonadaceae bacterium]|jgi:ubiquinone/menaquinone biosynthesis C-methylase UbiE|nr:methyltransferase domain-containing protein [Pyrinomonadaceae bacterium]
MVSDKTEKELAFLYDLYVATDWGERFAGLVDEHVKMPKRGRSLYVAAGTGGHALALKERGGEEFSLAGVDESGERVEIARAKAAALKALGRVEFHSAQLEALAFEDDQFDLVIGDLSLVVPERLPEILAEMVRVTAPGGTIALSVITASSFGEFFSVYWEAIINAGLMEQGGVVEALINELPTVSDVENMAKRETLDEVQSWTRVEEFNFASAEEFLSAPLVRDFLSGRWLDPLPDEAARVAVWREVERIIDDERQGGDFPLSIKATLVIGRKTE